MSAASSSTPFSLVTRAFGLIVATLLGCHTEGQTQPPSTSASTPTLSPASSMSALVGVGEPDAESARNLLRDRLFIQANASHDPVDFAALGEKAGASVLLRLLADPKARATALSAIPYCRDSDLAIRPLTSIARASPSADDAEVLLDTIAFALERPHPMGELLDADGIRFAVADLVAIAKNPSLSERVRGLAVTVLGRLADRGFVSRAEIPQL